MSEKNPGYNPEGLSPEEIAEIEAKAAERRKDLLAGIVNKSKPVSEESGVVKPAKKAELYSPSGVLLEKKPLAELSIGTRFTRRKTQVNEASQEDLLRAKGDIEDKDDKKENRGKELFKEVKKLLKHYKFGGEFRIRTSTVRGNYVFHLFPESDKFAKESELEFDDKADNIAARVQEYMDNTYDKV